MQLTGIAQRILPRIATAHLAGRPGLARRFWFEALAFAMVAALLIFFCWGMLAMSEPIGELKQSPISLDTRHLPEYALRTTLRMLIAVVISLLFTLSYATLAAKSRKAGQVMIPILDILQSVPVLGYISFTVTGFIALFPGSTLGVECAAIFAIFTSQAWNMAFSMYQSLRTIPRDMDEAATVFKLSGWQKFWKMEVPFAIPGLIWNMMISMSGGWFFVVASEAFTIGNQKIMLPGIGSYIALAIAERNLHAIGWAIATMGIVILLYDQFLFRPLIAWSDKFRYDMTVSDDAPSSWVQALFAKSKLARKLFYPILRISHYILRIRLFKANVAPLSISTRQARLFDYVWYTLLGFIGALAVQYIFLFLAQHVSWAEVGEVLYLGAATLLRVMILIGLATLLWVPLGVYIGLRPKLAAVVLPLAQFLSAFPANLLFPVAVMLISYYNANPNIWLSPLMILGTQWYILFNIVAGASAFPHDLRDVARSFHVKRFLWWKKVMLPAVFPYYLTGAIAASGGAWNASIVAEVVEWGNQRYAASGLGAYIAAMTKAGDFPHLVLGIGVMSLIVVMFNQCVWHPLYNMSARKLRLD